MKRLKLSVVKRNEFGRCAMRRLRGSGMVPAVIYGHSGTTPLTVNEKDLKELLKAKGHSASLVDVDVSGEATLLSDIADIQRDPISDKFLHVDFHEVSQTEKMTTVVPLDFFGEAIGVKNSGGALDIARHEVTVRCLPADLPASIRVDVGPLDIGDIVHIGGLTIPHGVELVGDPATPVVSCNAIAAETEESAKVATEAEPKAADAAAKEQVAKAEVEAPK
ncbi:MAG: 50S ribosomal protein L25 [Puniceicoccales bacterium]|nr:50S ribosomal protein L25 [Puniceicoccales bacterium]